MRLTVGLKVAYPNQGVCLVEEFKQCTVDGQPMSGYSLRVLHDNSTIFVPTANADNVGIRPLINATQCERLINMLSEDFEPVSCDWKTRSKQFSERLRSGDVFQAAEVLKMLTFLSHEKKLSFREQTLLEKSKFLILSELKNAYKKPPVEDEIIIMVETACSKHLYSQPRVMSAVSN
jgi:CarD family transcriptional regulator